MKKIGHTFHHVIALTVYQCSFQWGRTGTGKRKRTEECQILRQRDADSRAEDCSVVIAFQSYSDRCRLKDWIGRRRNSLMCVQRTYAKFLRSLINDRLSINSVVLTPVFTYRMTTVRSLVSRTIIQLLYNYSLCTVSLSSIHSRLRPLQIYSSDFSYNHPNIYI